MSYHQVTFNSGVILVPHLHYIFGLFLVSTLSNMLTVKRVAIWYSNKKCNLSCWLTSLILMRILILIHYLNPGQPTKPLFH
jgi:hypothetical protein